MTHVDTQIHALLPIFFEAWPFKYLPANVREAIAPKLQLCAFQAGQSIYRPKELPSLVHCVVQGNVRILGPSSHQNPTLAIVGQGGVVGWDSLIRRVAVGSVRAAMQSLDTAQTVITLALPADDFEALALRYLMPVLLQRISPTELFDTLACFLARAAHSTSSSHLKEFAQRIQQEQLAVVQNCYLANNPPLKALADTVLADTILANSASKDTDLADADGQLTPDRVWLVSGGPPLNLAIGKPVHSIEQLKLLRPSRFPVRLLGIDRSFITSINLQPEALNAIVEASEQPLDLHSSKAISLPSASDASRIAATSTPAQTTKASTRSRRKTYPIWRSPTPSTAEDVVACFGMVCDRLHVPYQPNSLRRWLTKQSTEQFEPFDLYVRIAQAIGFNAQIVQFTPTSGGINRLNTPALIQFGDVLTVLHEVTPTTAVLGSPRTGLLRLASTKLASRLTPDIGSENQTPSTCQAIILERFSQTSTKRFGFHWFLPILATQKGILLQVLLASVVIQLLGVANPLLVQQIIDNVIINANQGAMTMFGVLMVLFALIEGGLTILRRYLLSSTTNRVDLHLGIEVVRHMLHLPIHFFEKRPVGELSSRLSELENIRQFLTDSAITVVLDVIFSVLYIAVMLMYSVRLTACVLLSVPIIVISTLIISSIQQKLIRVRADHGAKVQSYLIEVLGGIAAVKAQHIEPMVEATWREKYVQYLTTNFTTSTISTIFFSFNNFLNTLSSLLVLWVGASVVIQGEMTLGGLIAFRILTGYVTGPLLRLASLWQRFQETSLSMDLLADIVESPAEELAPENHQLQMPPIAGRVQYQEISFGFAPGQLQLSNVSLDVAAGTFVGIVGQSGSGKSTLMKLLPRLYVPQSGNIFVDGYDVSKVNLSSLRSQVGIVSQDSVLFQGTIRDNIALFNDLSDDEIIEAAKIAEAHDFIMQLPEGYGTQVGEKGANLSGGQRQRIAIARAVMRNPRLLIFDEATSALDYETERRVCENLMRQFQDRTCFFITHRLNTVAYADWILFMRSGVIAEQGTHQDLMARRQLYYCLYTQQVATAQSSS